MDRDVELQLVERLRVGDPDAFDVVHAAFNGRLYNFLARLSNRREVAEDLLEETWLRLVVHARRLIATPAWARGCLPLPVISTPAIAVRGCWRIRTLLV